MLAPLTYSHHPATLWIWIEICYHFPYILIIRVYREKEKRETNGDRDILCVFCLLGIDGFVVFVVVNFESNKSFISSQFSLSLRLPVIFRSAFFFVINNRSLPFGVNSISINQSAINKCFDVVFVSATLLVPSACFRVLISYLTSSMKYSFFFLLSESSHISNRIQHTIADNCFCLSHHLPRHFFYISLSSQWNIYQLSSLHAAGLLFLLLLL